MGISAQVDELLKAEELSKGTRQRGQKLTEDRPYMQVLQKSKINQRADAETVRVYLEK